jgi:hypothetical protein
MIAREFLKSIGRKEIFQIATGEKTGEFLITPEQLEEYGKHCFSVGVNFFLDTNRVSEEGINSLFYQWLNKTEQ